MLLDDAIKITFLAIFLLFVVTFLTALLIKLMAYITIRLSLNRQQQLRRSNRSTISSIQIQDDQPPKYNDVSHLITGINETHDYGKYAPAKRLVLISADGLRQDTTRKSLETNQIPFLKKMTEIGSSGVSYSRVPTESRPGHIAIIAGFYEDISAVTRGWKENPIEFDSLFNRSTYCFAWGSPDILLLFTKHSHKINANYYSAYEENFASQNASLLDIWVLDKFSLFMEEAKQNKTLNELLNKKGIVFFFHLLGIDTNGHSKKPYSKEYLENLVLVDRIVEKLNKMINEFYSNDNLTSFIFTSDHGMTDWGSHGSGDDTERITPFISWGAGISHYSYLSIEQADITPLMSYLIGVPIPVNSVGKIPINILNTNDKNKAFILKSNAQQIYAQIKVQYNKFKSTAYFFKEYQFLTMKQIENTFKVIDEKIANELLGEALKDLDKLIDSMFLALDYYNVYYKFYLGSCIVLSFIGWIMYLIYFSWKLDYDRLSHTMELLINTTSFLTFFLTIHVSYVQQFSLTQYIYGIIPILLWRNVFLQSNYWSIVFNRLKDTLFETLLKLTLLIVAVEILVLSFFYRKIFFYALTINSLVMITYFIYMKIPTYFKWLLVISSTLLSVFPLLPVIDGTLNMKLVYITFCIIIISYLYLNYKFKFFYDTKSKFYHFFILFVSLLSLLNVYIVRNNVDKNDNVPLVCNLFSYFMLLLWIIVSITSTSDKKIRLFRLLFCLYNLYLHLSISIWVAYFVIFYYFIKRYESLFIIILSLQMISWLLFECYLSSGEFSILGNKQNLKKIDEFNWSNIFRVYSLLFHLLLAFFGTGNMASINSFDPVSVYCFVTVFSPFLMAFLLVIKILIPFLIVIIIFYFIHDINGISIGNSFVSLIIISDLMALNFFFLIKTNGSWLDIGISISHYAISMISIIFIPILFYLSQFLFTFKLDMNGKKKIIDNDRKKIY